MNLPVEKNKIYEMTIHGLGSNGEGVGRIEDFAIFVEGALPQEKIRVQILKVKKNYGYGKLIEILETSQERVTPCCPVAKKCGGCQLQHLSYEGQLRYKAQKVKADLERIGGLKNVGIQAVLGMEQPLRYRNKAQFPVGEGVDGSVEIGFFAKRSHRIVDVERCLLQDEANDRLVQILRDFMTEFHIAPYNEEKHSGLVRHILTRVGRNSGEIMVCIVVNGNTLPHAEVLVERLRRVKGVVSVVLNINKKCTNVILGEKIKVLWGKATIQDSIGGISFEISPLSFYQVNPLQTEILYHKALEMANLTGNETVLDLYCGIGTISLFFAKKAKKVFGVEIVPEAIADAKRNAEQNGIKNVVFAVGAAEEVIPDLYATEEITADVVVVDPPRKGCERALLETIVKMAPEKLIYISCNPATLARDVAVLTAEGFTVQEVAVVDQFPMTVHVECVCLLTRNE